MNVKFVLLYWLRWSLVCWLEINQINTTLALGYYNFILEANEVFLRDFLEHPV